MLKKLLLALSVSGLVLSTCINRGGAQQAQPVQVPFSLTAAGQRLPTINLIGSMSSCAIVIYNSGGGFTITPQAASDGQGNSTPTWVTASSVGGGSITATGTFVGQVSNSGLTSFGGILASLVSGTVSGVETCSNGIPTGSVSISSLPPFTGNVTIVAPTNGAGQVVVAVGNNPAATPAATASAGIPPTASAQTNNVIDQCFVPAGATPNVTGGNIVAAQCNANGQLLVSTVTAPSASPLCDSGAALCTFSLNAALPTIAPGNFPGFTNADANGTAIVFATPSPNATTGVASIPVQAFLMGQCGTSSQFCPVSAGGQAATGAARVPLNVNVCNNTTGTCGVVTGTGADATANTSMGAPNSTAFLYAFNGTTWDRVREGVSPAPVGVAAVGYNAGGVANPVICTKTATVALATTQATETVMVASASGKLIYVCSAVISGLGTAVGKFSLATSAANTCSSTTDILTSYYNTTGVDNIALGSGVGVVAQAGSGLALCFVTTGTPADATATIMYEQFLHSLSPQQLEDFCAVPKRCALYGLFTKLNKLLDPIP